MKALELACNYVKEHRTDEVQAPHYIFHLPRSRMSYVGLGCHKTIRYQRDGFYVQTRDGTEHHAATDRPFEALRTLIDPAYPCFLLISSDLNRAAADTDLPLLLCVQPLAEVGFSGFDGGSKPSTVLSPQTFDGWRTQPDDEFLKRLAVAVEALSSTPGKMIMTRAYQKNVGERDRLDLFELFARSEPMAACSHFLQIDKHVHSLGCSPENIFEVDRGRIMFDVVAATRGISPDPVIDQRWLAALQSDPKERREHMMAFDRYKARIETLVDTGTLSIDQTMQVLQLGNVRHLHSKISGRLRADLDWLRLLEGSFPPLTSYPEALVPLSDVPDEPNRFYGGVIGRIAAGGQQAAFFLNIRAAVLKQHELYTQGGVGVIAESQPAKELLEVKNKLRGLMKAISAWESGA